MVVESGGVGGFCPVIWLKSFASLELLASLNDGKLVPSNCLEHRCTISALIGTNANHESTSNIDGRVRRRTRQTAPNSTLPLFLAPPPRNYLPFHLRQKKHTQKPYASRHMGLT